MEQLLEIQKILNVFPEKRISSELVLLESKNGALFVELNNKLLEVLLEPSGVQINEVNPKIKQELKPIVKSTLIQRGD